MKLGRFLQVLVSKLIGPRFNLSFFLGRVSPSESSTETTLKIPLRQLKFVPIEVTCITSITPNGGGSVFPWVLEACPVALPSGTTTNSFKCPDFTNCSKWSLNTLYCLVVCPFSRWYVQYKFWFVLAGSPLILLGHRKYGSFFIRSKILWTSSLNTTLISPVRTLGSWILNSLLCKLDTSLTPARSIELYEFRIFRSKFQPILMYLFRFSFLTTLDINKTYFKNHHTWKQRPRALFSLWEAIAFIRHRVL